MSVLKTVFILFAVVCSVTFLRAQVTSTKDYIDAYKYAAMQEMKIYKIPASITLAQGILESSSGNSKLAKECNNHFGIKCRKNWTGTFCLADDDAPNECFRGYPSPMESFRDHSLFLTQSPRYSNLFSMQATDYRAWAEGLKKDGYATNPSYPSALVGVIEKFRLGMYDSVVLFGEDYVAADSALKVDLVINGLPAVYAKDGQTPADIAKVHELAIWEIYKYNDLKKGENLNPGEIVYLKPKRRKGSIAKVTVEPGQDMREISQLYGIKLKHLYKKNHLKPGQEVKPGEVLNLQKKSATAPETVARVEKVEPKIKPAVKKPEVKPIEKTNSDFYEVLPDETLYSIAVKTGISIPDLILWNNLENAEIKPGQILVLKKKTDPTGTADTTKAGNTEEQLEKSVKYHVVLAGETVYSIAKLYSQSIDSIVAWNNIVNNAIKPGMELIVTKKKAKKAPVSEVPKTYTVQPGDTLYSICRRYGISVNEIKKLNDLKSDTISSGQVLLLQ